MVRIVLTIIFVAVALAVVALVDCALSPGAEVRTLPKVAWLAIVVVLPVVGPLLWFVFGRARATRARVSPAAPHPNAPDDDSHFLSGLDAEARVRRLEAELARLEEEERGDSRDDGRGGA